MARGSAKITVLHARNAASGAASGKSAASYALFGLDTLDRFPGPALVADQNLRVLRANVHAGLLVEALEAPSGPVATLIRRTFAHDAPIVHKLSLVSRSGVHHIELFALPTTIAKSTRAKATLKVVAVLCRDMTLEQNLTQSLVASRQMFKDLLSCSGDFAWETDTDGIFRYVSPKGGFGYGAHEMAGRPASDFLASPQDDHNPFLACDSGHSGTFNLLNGDGSIALVHLVAVPVVDGEGRWQGTRGICRDISAHARRDLALRKLQTMEALQGALVALAASNAAKGGTANDLLRDAAALIGAHAGVRISAFLYNEQGLTGIDPGFDRENLAADTIIRRHLTVLADADAHPAKTVEVTGSDDRTYLLIALRLGARSLGALALHPDQAADRATPDETPWPALDAVADILAFLLDHARLNSALHQAPAVDDLHRLLDKTAITELLTERISNRQRTGQVVVMEIDGWHTFAAQVDEAAALAVLNDFAAHLHATARDADLVAWLGEGRFALWLERSDTPGAVAKIERLKRLLKEIALPNGVAQSRLTLSAGIAPWPQMTMQAGAPSSAADLVAKATDALQSACRHGRGHWAVADASATAGPTSAAQV
jgi:diguanylate cyclase (GGDEF)-like protein/PAS domain S-box-containing protein